MRALGRHVLSFLLAIALIASGGPFAHALPSHAIDAVTTHEHIAEAGCDHMMHMAVHHEDVVAGQGYTYTSDPGATDILKDPKCCSMCATAYVEPSLRDLHVALVSFAVRYDVRPSVRLSNLTFVDPEIPIV